MNKIYLALTLVLALGAAGCTTSQKNDDIRNPAATASTTWTFQCNIKTPQSQPTARAKVIINSQKVSIETWDTPNLGSNDRQFGFMSPKYETNQWEYYQGFNGPDLSSFSQETGYHFFFESQILQGKPGLLRIKRGSWPNLRVVDKNEETYECN